MATNQDLHEEESFIILGTSPGTSLDLKCNGTPIGDAAMTRANIEDALKDLSAEANMAFKAHFKLGDCPSPASLMAASTLVSDDATTVQLQKKFGEILDENVILKETLKTNNNSMKEQFLLIASCQEDMLKTHRMHQEKFDETRELVERLRQENKKLKLDMTRLIENSSPPNSTLDASVYRSVVAPPETAKPDKTATAVEQADRSGDQSVTAMERSGEKSATAMARSDRSGDQSATAMVRSGDQSVIAMERSHQSGDQSAIAMARSQQSGDQSATAMDRSGDQSAPLSAIEFVTSPDDDVINKLTAQLELVEKQRRQVIAENEKLTWQKESLETIVDVTAKERDDYKEKLKNIESKYSSQEEKHAADIKYLKFRLEDLQLKLQNCNQSVPKEEVTKREIAIQQLEVKVATLQTELKNSQLKILDLESVKLEFSRQKAGIAETAKIYKDQIQDLHNRLKEAQTTVFQPVRFSLSPESDSSLSEGSALVSNVKLYDRTLKHLSDLLNATVNGTSEHLAHVLSLLSCLHDYKLERATVDNFKSGLGEVKALVEKQHAAQLINIAQIKRVLTIFEGIFQEYKELLKKALTKPEPQPSSIATAANVEALTAALVARGKELQATQEEANLLRTAVKQASETEGVIQAQLEVYKTDFEQEREAREKMARDMASMTSELRHLTRQNDEMTAQLEELHRTNPTVYKSLTAAKKRALASTKPAATGDAAAASAGTTGNMVYKCPKCLRFSSDQYKVMEDHFDFCLDDF